MEIQRDRSPLDEFATPPPIHVVPSDIAFPDEKKEVELKVVAQLPPVHHHPPPPPHPPSPSAPPSPRLSTKPKKKVPVEVPKQELKSSAQERKVPSSRISRLVNFGQLGLGLGVGALTDAVGRGLGLKKSQINATSILGDNPFLNEANAERIVRTLCRVRGAALKLGQMLSLQDNTMISPQLAEIFERVRNSADFMPKKQVEKVMRNEFGADWMENFAEFDDRPFAAASIGQVHRAKLKNGREVALKIQYPGVAQSINSDIDNLMSLLNFGNLLPKGLYMQAFVKVARNELVEECDYKREAEMSTKFKQLLASDPLYYCRISKISKITVTFQLLPLVRCKNLYFCV